ncbi:MAG TPA: CPBP family intramembrane metalloprotease [Saprospiraceae bacterium]|nr:CPBP family intramembrane metalloprotease [Saprospiraceae bacterium]HPI06338.1 CPBP family intramembrane metalloprotease [Saprospiraceae bacterium]
MFQESAIPDPVAPWQMPAPKVRVVLLALLSGCIFFALGSTFLSQLIVHVGGWNENLLSAIIAPDAPAPERWQMRLLLGIRHFSTFAVAGFLVVWMLYRGITRPRPGWPDYLLSREWPGWRNAILGMLLLLVSVPLVLFLFQINKMIPLPDSFKAMEEQANDAIKALLIMDNAGEFMGNMLLIALLPAVGEELVFRGVVQQQLMRRIGNPWWALALSAAVFSFFHFQFEGFLSRVLLGFLLGWLYWETRNFWVPVIAHFFNNGVQVIAQYASNDKNSVVDLEQDVQVPWFVALLSLFMVLVTMRLIRQRGS